jgi:hypothetical protein
MMLLSHAASRQVISQEIAELEAAHQRDAINPPPLSLPPF